MQKFFSIITATYNAAATLPRLLESLACQTCRDVELIIQDGASTDATIAVAEAYAHRLPALSIASEADGGIYDAWNRALSRARGDWVLFMGADDELADAAVLERCHAVLRGAPAGAMYAGGGIALMSRGGEVVSHTPYMPDGADARMRKGMPFPHPALWHRRSLFHGERFDTTLRIAADYEFVCRTWTRENGATVLPFTVTRMRRGGVSDSPRNVLRVRWENALVASRYFSGTWTPARCVGLFKGCLLWVISRLLGAKAPVFLDALRRWRGLPPVWRGL